MIDMPFDIFVLYRLEQVAKSYSEYKLDFFNHVRQLYNSMLEQDYETQGRKLSVERLLSIHEEKAFEECLSQIVSCIEGPFRKYIHVFDVNS
jgi:hypothetical protein